MEVRNFMLARALLLAAGVVTTFAVTAADLLGLDPTPGWGPARRTELFIGLSLLAASYFLYNRHWQLWFVSRFGFRLDSPGKIAAVLFARVILLVAGAASTFLTLFGDIFGLVRYPGWTEVRFFHLTGSLLLLAGGIVLCWPGLQRWMIRKLGLRWLSPAQMIIILFGLVFLILPGAFTTFLSISADWLGLDGTPGMGRSRTLGLWIGLSLLVGGVIFLSRRVQIWILHRIGAPLQSGPEAARGLIARLCLWLTGLALTFLSLFAHWLGFNYSGRWNFNRWTALISGLILLAAAILLSSKRPRRWIEQKLAHPDKLPGLF